MVELKMNMIVDNIPFLINAVDRGVNHPLYKIYRNIQPK